MVEVANNGYRAIAIDFRGYGLSDHPAEPEKANLGDLVDDVVSLLDSLNISKVINSLLLKLYKVKMQRNNKKQIYK